MLEGLRKEKPDLFDDRMLRCIVVAARRSVQGVDKAIAMDWRDLIVSAEYDWGDCVRLLTLPFGTHPEVELMRQWMGGQQIIIPWGVGNDDKSTIDPLKIRELSLQYVRQLKEVSKAVADPNLYFAGLDFLYIQGPKEISASKAIRGRVSVIYRIMPDTKEFQFQRFICRPQDLVKCGKW